MHRKPDMANGLSKTADPALLRAVDAVRPAVRDLLLSVPAFQKLSPAEQQRIASGMVKITSYMANPSGVADLPVATAQADATEPTKQPPSNAPGQVAQYFTAAPLAQE